MDLRHTSRRLGAVLLIVFFSAGTARADLLERILAFEGRPEVFEIAQISGGRVKEYVGDVEPTATEQKILQLYVLLVEEFLKNVPERKIVLLGRSMDEVYDSVQAVLAAHPLGYLLQPRFIRLRVSRKLTENSTSVQLATWLRIHGLEPTAFMNDLENIWLVDVGYAGTAPREMLRAVLNAIPGDAENPSTLATAAASNFGVRLMVSNSPEKFRQWQKELARGDYRTLNKIVNSISTSRNSFGFPALYDDTDSWKRQIGLGTTAWNSWVSEHFDNGRPRWRGRPLKLTSDGTSVTSYDPPSAYDANVNKKGVLRWQYILRKYMQSTEVVSRLSPLIGEAVEKVLKNRKALGPNDVDLIRITPLTTPDSVFIPEIGQCRIVQAVHHGRKTNLFQIHPETDSNVHYLLKVRKKNAPEDCIEKDIKRLQKLFTSGFNHPDLITFGEDYLVRKWIQGTSAKKWLRNWEAAGAPTNSPELRALHNLVVLSQRKKLYVRNLRPSNIVFTTDQLEIVDSGSLREKLAKDDVAKRYRENFEQRWATHLGESCRQEFVSAIMGGTEE